ncbi:hypothetical protein ACTFIZ_001893 [Dictyostelium cf. discoideum]
MASTDFVNNITSTLDIKRDKILAYSFLKEEIKEKEEEEKEKEEVTTLLSSFGIYTTFLKGFNHYCPPTTHAASSTTISPSTTHVASSSTTVPLTSIGSSITGPQLLMLHHQFINHW